MLVGALATLGMSKVVMAKADADKDSSYCHSNPLDKADMIKGVKRILNDIFA